MATNAVQARGRVMASLTVIKRFAVAINQDTSSCDIEVRLTKMDDLWNEFQAYETQVATLLDANPNANVELKQEEFETKFFETKSKLLEWFRKSQPQANSPPTQNNSFDQLLDQQRIFLESLADRTQAINERSMVQSADNIKLPRVSFDKFEGDYETWPSFYDLYCTSVHNVDTFSQVRKFQILKGMLKGPPLNIIRNFLVTEANYSEAWDKLVKRYNKRRPILTSHIDRFFNQPSASNGSPEALRQISDTSDEIIRGIKALGQDAESRDPWLIRILLNKVDEDTQIAWAQNTINEEFPKIDEFLEFLNNRCYAKENVSCGIKKKVVKGSSGALKSMHTSSNIENCQLNEGPSGVVKSMHTSSNVEKCSCCGGKHYLWRCLKFKKMSILDRRQLANQSRVCYNCLRDGHAVNDCSVNYSCRICNARHSTLLHADLDVSSKGSVQVSSVSQTKELPTTNKSKTSSSTNSSIASAAVTNTAIKTRTSRLALLPTAVIYVHDSLGKHHAARVLLDSGSQSTFISESLVQRLNLARSFANVRVSGIAATSAESAKGLVKINIQSRFKPSELFEVEALILTKLTSTIPQIKVDAEWVDDINKQIIQLADPNYHIPSKIDILLGADIFFEILNADRFNIQNRLFAQSTKFGWVISGSTYEGSNNLTALSSITHEEDISMLLEKFWTIEEVPTISEMSKSEKLCEHHFLENFSRNSEGRYVVRLPIKKDSGALGHSKTAAISRLMAMERKFKKNHELQEQYTMFMNEYLNLGHMDEIKSTEPTCQETTCFYLPHHAIVKRESTTTALRVVFDGSSKSATGVSLNDKLLVGPTIQKDLISILMSFRTHAIAFSADVEKMYRQIKVNPLDQNFQRVIWRNSTLEKMRTFKLNTVTYGTSCAPFLAVRTLHQIAEDNKLTYPIGFNIAIHDFYVDDCLSGADSVNDAKLATQQLTDMLAKGQFKLRKWKSNSLELLNTIPAELREKNSLCIDDNSETIKTLGLQWNPIKDTFTFKFKFADATTSSKREMLSQIARIFDPVGWISPVVIVFKISMQKLWLRKLGWDDPLPTDIEHQWMANKATLQELENIEVPRFLMTTQSTLNVQIHGFCDASEHAYAAVIYLRTIDQQGNPHTRLVISKTKVAPLKQVSLPRLELCGAVLLNRLIKYTERALELSNVQCFAWTDSKIVLSWLSDVPRRWKCFIGNRTSEILENVPHVKWQHVASKDNPADIASRGVTPLQLLECKEWWNGPHWLIKPIEQWPAIMQFELTNLEERHITLATQLNDKSPHLLENLFQRIESFTKVKRILVKVLSIKRLYRNQNGVDLLKRAESICTKWAQSEEFHNEIQSLNQNKKIGTNSKILSLSPFLDNEGIMRVGGRLENLDASYNTKHPIILPSKHIISERIIQESHNRYLHPGPTLQTSILRQKFWIINCRNMVRSYINKCVKCRRHRAATSQQMMGNLPSSRITPSRPFLHTGVDYAGPLFLKSRVGRGRIPLTKGYICLFVCFSTKAVHIELCHDMTAEAFIAALRRFISRRGIPREIISDNGTNFVGARRKLGELYELYKKNYENKLISHFISQNEIKFTVNPASGPHFGGLWEAGIKSIKHHLNRVAGNITMTSDEMQTLLVQIEGILNSRPLCPISNDVDDLSALTPAHFLIGEPITTIPEPSVEHISINRLSRWQNVQARMQGFWKHWQTTYLHTLQHRRKWPDQHENLKLGDLVLLKEDNLSPATWQMGRIVACHPGQDGLVRVVSVRTSSGIIKRPTVKICLLISDDNSKSLVSYLHVLKPGGFNSPGVC